MFSYNNKAIIKSILHKTKVIPLAYDYWISDHYMLGRLVEALGDRQKVDGCLFDLSNERIETSLKSRFLLNQYEKEERESVKKFFDSKTPVVEFGASIGVISCITNKILSRRDKHVVIEANPYLIPALESNKALNRSKFKILNLALAYHKKMVNFYLHHKFVGGSIQRKTKDMVLVKATSLNKILKDYEFKKINLICDIEGGEALLIRQELEVLQKKVKYFMVEMHPAIIGEKLVERLISEIKKANFNQEFFKRQVYVFKNTNL